MRLAGKGHRTSARRSGVIFCVVIAPTCALLLALRQKIAPFVQSPSTPWTSPFPVSSSSRGNSNGSLYGLWQVGSFNASLDFELDDIAARVAPDVFPSAQSHGVGLHTATETGVPPRIVPRAPSFRLLHRPVALPAPPDGSLYLERPLPGVVINSSTPSCLFTRDAALGHATFARGRGWTLEAVVLFLDNSHFAGQWQTIIGRNGAATPRPCAPKAWLCTAMTRGLAS